MRPCGVTVAQRVRRGHGGSRRPRLAGFSMDRCRPKSSPGSPTSGTAGVVEDRCDVYRIEEQPRVDVGVKRRDGATLELKLRVRGTGAGRRWGAIWTAWTESWQRWSPAGGRVESQATKLAWAEVDKTHHQTPVRSKWWRGAAVSRCPGQDPPRLRRRSRLHLGRCDATEWSFAFAAFGPSQTTTSALPLHGRRW